LTRRIRRAPWHSPLCGLYRVFGPPGLHPSTLDMPTALGFHLSGLRRLPLGSRSSSGGCGWRPRSPPELGPGFLVDPTFAGPRFVRDYSTSARTSDLPPPFGRRPLPRGIRGSHGRTRERAQGCDQPHFPRVTPEFPCGRDAMPPRGPAAPK
jgi:hypothetical protein